MGNLSNIGRIFYGIAMAIMGFLTIFYHDFPYILIPPHRSWIDGLSIVAYVSGAFLLLAGVATAFKKRPMTISLLLGTVLLLVFCFYFVPYEFFVSPNYTRFGAWENAAKELTLASGAFVIAGVFSTKNENPFIRSLRKLIPLGVVVYSLTIISYGIDHFIAGKDAADYIPSWIPAHIFWIYFAGVALLGSGLAILLNIKRRLAATLLGTMIFIWVVILHIPKAIASPMDNQTGEVTSGCLALAYCGIAFVIAGAAKKA